MTDERLMRNRHTAPHYTWGEGCDGFLLVDDEHLSVIEEVVPPGTGETWHLHSRARQFFYILEGAATMQFRDGDVLLNTGDGVEVPPGIEHRFANHSERDVRFLVTSTPSTRGDRLERP